MRKLYEIRSDILGLANIAESGDLAAAAALDAELAIEAKDKLAQYYHLIQSCQGDIAEAEVAIKTATEFKKKKTGLVEWLELKITETLTQIGETKIDRPDCRITLVNGREILKRCKPEELPLEYVEIKIEEVIVPDWKKIEADVKAGKAVPGCSMGRTSPFLKYPKIKGEE